MRKIFLLLVIFPLLISAENKVEIVLDKAVSCIQNEMPLKIDFTYELYNNEGVSQFVDAGEMILSKDGRYMYTLSQIKVWCDGEKQWSYMSQTNEMYITSADGEDGQSLSPLYLMQLYKSGYKGGVEENKEHYVVTLNAPKDADYNKVELVLNKKNMQLETAKLYTFEGAISILINKYIPKISVTKEQFCCPLNEYSGAEIIDMIN